MGGRGSGSTPVIVQEAEAAEFVDSVEAIGTAQANESVTITSPVTENVASVHFEDGMRVEAGQILVELTQEEEEALLAEAKANREEAGKQLERVRSLVEQNALPAERLDEQVALYDAANARVRTTEARLHDRTIRAPFSGVLGLRRVSPGTLVSPGDIITTLDDIDIIKLDFDVPETFLGNIRPGLGIVARSAAFAGEDFRGTVSSINSRVDPVTRAITIRAEIPNPDHLLRPGMLLTVTLTKDQRQALSVPEEALVAEGDRHFVFIINGDQQAQRLEVEIGQRRPGTVEIISGVEPGQRVVTEGSIRLRPGAPVNIIQTL